MVIKWAREVLTGPRLSSMLEGLNPCHKIASRFVRHPSTSPGGDSRRQKTGAFELGNLKAEMMGFRCGGRDVEDERDMVRGGAKAGSKGGVGERDSEGTIDERLVKPSQGWSVSFARPSVKSV